MEETSLHGVRSNGDSSTTARPAGGLTASEDANVDDPPPIPSASASKHLTEKSVGVSRLDDTKTTTTENAAESIHDTAHALTIDAVTRVLATDPVAGLDSNLIGARREKYGRNKLETSGKTPQFDSD